MLIQSCNPPISDALNRDRVAGVYPEAVLSSSSLSIQYVFRIIVSIIYQYDLFILSVNINTKL
jgi:hypothetical protein